MSPSYLAFGLAIQSNCPIPGLIELSPDPFPEKDVQINLGIMPAWFQQTGPSEFVQCYESPHVNEKGDPILKVYRLRSYNCILLAYADDTRFLIKQDTLQVWATWPENLTLEDTATYLLGPVFGLLLRLKGLVCLHASAFAIGDNALCLLGQAGRGKSTTAAAFAKSGYTIVSDDIVALSEQDNRFYVLPGYPRIRLWPESGAELFGSRDVLPLLTPNWDKQYLDLTGSNYRFAEHPLPLSAIYILGDRTNLHGVPEITGITKRNAFMALVENTYMNYLLTKEMRAREFEVLNRLGDRVAIRHAAPEDDISCIEQFCNSVVADYQKLTRQTKTD